MRISEPTEKEEEKMSKDIINRITGDFGVWQLRTVLIIFLCKIPSSWFMACIIFTAPAPYTSEYSCRPEVEHLRTEWKATNDPIRNSNSYANITEESHFLAHDDNQIEETEDHCYIFKAVNTSKIENENRNNSASSTQHRQRKQRKINEKAAKGAKLPTMKMPCREFQFNSKFYSLVMQFNLVCSREIFVAWTQFWHLFGVLVGGIVATKLMYIISPRRVMLLGMTTQIICGCLTGLINNFNSHCFFRMMSAICCALMFTSGQYIFSDITGGKYRTSVNTLFDQFWSIGVILLPELSNALRSWTEIYLVITFPTLILIFLYKWIPDSPRWLLQHDRIEQCEEILMNSIKINDRKHFLPANFQEELQNYSKQLKNLHEVQRSTNWLDLWTGNKRAAIHFVAAHIAWAVYVTNFNGMLLNIRSFGREYLSVNTIITGISEIVGCFLALHFILKTKHKWQWAGVYNIIAGLIGCFGWFIPTSDTINNGIFVTMWMVISCIPKAGVSISQSMLIACSGELVEQRKRPAFIFSCIVWARIWLLTAPFINVLKNIDTALSLTVFSILTLIGGVCTCCLSNEVIHQGRDPSQLPQSNGEGVLPGNQHNQENKIWTLTKNDEFVN